ncbi:MAG TPA: hypothetical protein VJ461_02440 [Candidatus Nanoarchaeia archaeon]|nr:hypothetical protein [Candidatus Nanoarchaeia archaeon]
MLEEKLVLDEKPDEEISKLSLMQRTRSFLKNKWVKLAGGAIIAGGLMLGAARRADGQTTKYYYPGSDKDDILVGQVVKGDYDQDKDLDFMLGLFDKKNDQGEQMWVQVHESYDRSNRDVIDEVRYRINSPEQYPLIEVLGDFKENLGMGDFDGKVNPKLIITKDLEGNEEVFYTDPSHSGLYLNNYCWDADYVFFPGRHLTHFYYPHFYFGSFPGWDWDMDGLPNWMDPHPTWNDTWNWGWFDPWGWGAFDTWWSWGGSWGWGWNWGWNSGWSWHNPYWNYWGGWHHYADPTDYPGKYRDVMDRIRKAQLQRPAEGGLLPVTDMVANYVKDDAIKSIQRRDLTRIFNPQELRQLGKNRATIFKENYNALVKNPIVVRRDESGREVRVRIDPSTISPLPTGMISPGSGSQGTTIRGNPPSGSVERRGETKGSSEGTIKKKNDESQRSYIPEYQSRYSSETRSLYSGQTPRQSSANPSLEQRLIRPPSIQREYERLQSNPERRIILPNENYMPKERSIIRDNSSYSIAPRAGSIIQMPRSSNIRSPSTIRAPTYKAPSVRSSTSKSSYRPSSSSRSSSSVSRSYSPSRSSSSSGSVRKKN